MFLTGVKKNDLINSEYIISRGATPLIGDYPIFDENYREVLNRKIVRHYYFWESGFETYARFQFELNRKMNEIMPYYNKLYESELIDIKPFINQDYVEKYLGHGFEDREFTHGKVTTETRNFIDHDIYSGNARNTMSYGKTTDTQNGGTDDRITSSQNNSTSSGEKQDNFSDTPEQGLDQAKAEHWLTNVTWGENSNTSQGTESGSDKLTTSRTGKEINSGSDSNVADTSGDSALTHSGTGDFKNSGKDLTDIDTMNDYIKQITGNAGMAPLDVLKDLRDSYLNIDMMIIKDLQILFNNMF